MAEDEKPIVAFLGPEASYTHQATLSRFPPTTTTLLPLTNIADVFAAVQSRTARYGVVPFENSSNGSVVFTLDLFGDANAANPDILVEGEVYITVSHCLLGRQRAREESNDSSAGTTENPPPASVTASSAPTPSQPLSPSDKTNPVLPTLDHITKIYSHPQAWGQCTRFLASTPHLKAIERQDVSSTSRAAQLAAEDLTGKSAAISSKIAAGMNGLEVLREGIEDRVGNCTRFFVLRRREGSIDGGMDVDGGSTEEEKRAREREVVGSGKENVQAEVERNTTTTTTSTSDEETESVTDRNERERDDSVYDYYRPPSIPVLQSPPQSSPSAAAHHFRPPSSPSSATHKTLLTFTISHADPGALAASLSVFSNHGLNLTSINTRPSGIENWNYIFFVELQGRREEGGRGEVNEALRELGSVCRGWRWLGSWDNALRR